MLSLRHSIMDAGRWEQRMVSFFDRIMGYNPSSYRFLFLLGAMKSGTSSLVSLLGQHPLIFRGTIKEPGFFAEKGRKCQTSRAYMANWPLRKARKAGDAWLLDGSTAYSKYPAFGDAASNIAAFTPAAKFIYMMRDPVARIESQIAHNVARSTSYAALYTRLQDDAGFYKYYLQVSSYATQLSRYGAHFNRADILLLRFEDVIRGQEQALAPVWPFLGVSAPDRLVYGHQNARREAVKGKHFLSDTVRSNLHAALAPDMAKLRDDWGVDTSLWGF